MINLQNPSIPVATNPIEIDRVIVDLNTKLSDNITWLTHAYGQAYKNVDATQNQTVFYPEVYLGKQNNSQRYVNISPDNDKTGQCFFLVTQESYSEFQQGQYGYLTYDMAIIFSVNLKLINETLLQTEYFRQNCIAEVRNCLTRIPSTTNHPYQLTINDVDLLFENIFSEFDINEQQVLEKAPLTHFRVNCTVVVQEECIDFSPAPEPPLTSAVLWLKADAGVNGGAVSNGDLVNTWADQSGNNNDFTQLVGASQPEYKSSGTLGVPCIYFNGFNSINRLSSTLFTDGSVGTYFIVYQQLLPPPSTVNGGSLMTNLGAFSTGNFLTFYTERSALGDNYVYGGSGFAGNQSVGLQDDLPHYVGVSKDATTMDYYYDSDTSVGTNVVVQDWSVFQNHYIGSQTGAGAYMIGDIYEVLAWNKKLDASELAELANYFNSKYGL